MDNGTLNFNQAERKQVLTPERLTRTPTFDLREVGETHLKVQEENGDEGLLRANVAVSGAIVFININAEERGYPIVIENSSDFDFVLSQAVGHEHTSFYASGKANALQQTAAEAGRRTSDKKYNLNAHQNMPFAWDDPMQEEKLLRLSAGSFERDIKVMEIGAQVPFKFAVCC